MSECECERVRPASWPGGLFVSACAVQVSGGGVRLFAVEVSKDPVVLGGESLSSLSVETSS